MIRRQWLAFDELEREAVALPGFHELEHAADVRDGRGATARRASRTNRSTVAGSSSSCGRRTLSATTRFVSMCAAR